LPGTSDGEEADGAGAVDATAAETGVVYRAGAVAEVVAGAGPQAVSANSEDVSRWCQPLMGQPFALREAA
jgi:hypothetical protein